MPARNRVAGSLNSARDTKPRVPLHAPSRLDEGVQAMTTTPADSKPALTRETIGDRVYDPMEFARYSMEKPTIARFYVDDPDMSMVVWGLEPGQETDTHAHADFGQTFIILCGNGILLRGPEQEPVDVKAGEVIIHPRNMMHGLRNTGTERLSYMAITTRPAGART